MTAPLYGLIEAGGTKFVLGLAGADRQIIARHRVATTRPEETLSAVVAWFRQQAPVAAFGIASFGPLSLDRSAPDWGHITQTTKPHWSGADIAGPLIRAFDRPVAIDTDVNGAALAEYHWGACQGQAAMVYFTVGTGIGGGAVVGGRIVQGLSHPEMGHFYLPRHAQDLEFAGHCPFHQTCLEGLAAGPAIIARWGVSLSDLPADHPGHEIIASYLAHAAVTMQAVLGAGRVIFGGGVMATPGLIERVQLAAAQLGNSYFAGDAAQAITLPGLGDNAGLLGALALAQNALASQNASACQAAST